MAGTHDQNIRNNVKEMEGAIDADSEIIYNLSVIANIQQMGNISD